MKELNKQELMVIIGGKCVGIWLGTKDGEYGLCVGMSEN
ncbi:bacteriocin [Vibrio sp. S9_S30]|nr:bacteriocin [Vibrio sp. S9_S30]MBD1558536.1 bacteriocin [Vibrio sp. S9_S30]MBD1558538.1 bacteriocin [Vibrio sp. S9_S30]